MENEEDKKTMNESSTNGVKKRYKTISMVRQRRSATADRIMQRLKQKKETNLTQEDLDKMSKLKQTQRRNRDEISQTIKEMMDETPHAPALETEKPIQETDGPLKKTQKISQVKRSRKKRLSNLSEMAPLGKTQKIPQMRRSRKGAGVTQEISLDGTETRKISDTQRLAAPKKTKEETRNLITKKKKLSETDRLSVPTQKISETKRLTAPQKKLSETDRLSLPAQRISDTKRLAIPEQNISETQKPPASVEKLSQTKKLPIPNSGTPRKLSETRRRAMSPNEVKEAQKKFISQSQKTDKLLPETKKNQKTQYQVTLDVDRARVWEALHYDIIKAKDIIWALWFHFLAEGKRAPLLDILWRQEMLDEKQYKALQKVGEKKVIYEETYTVSKEDLDLAYYFVSCKIITRSGMQHVLTIANYLHQLNVHYSIDSLVVELKIANLEVVNQLIAQFHKQVQEGILNTDITVFSQKAPIASKKNNHLTTIAAVVFILLLPMASALTLALLYQSDKIIPQDQSTALPIKKKPKIDVVRKQQQQPDLSETDKWRDKHLAAKKLAKWGDDFITYQQQQKLLKHYHQNQIVDSGRVSPKDVTIQYKHEKEKYFFTITGKFSAPYLPQELGLKIVLQLCHGLTREVYLQNSFVIEENNTFTMDVVLPGQLLPGKYGIYLLFDPAFQNKFTKNFIQISPQKHWLPIVLGTGSEIQTSYNKSKKKLEYLVVGLNNQYRDFIDIQQRDFTVIEKHEYSEESLVKLTQMEKSIHSFQGSSFIPVTTDFTRPIMQYIQELKKQLQIFDTKGEKILVDPQYIIKLSRIEQQWKRQSSQVLSTPKGMYIPWSK